MVNILRPIMPMAERQFYTPPFKIVMPALPDASTHFEKPQVVGPPKILFLFSFKRSYNCTVIKFKSSPRMRTTKSVVTGMCILIKYPKIILRLLKAKRFQVLAAIQ